MSRRFGKTVGQLQQEMSSQEFAEQIAYERVELMDPERDDLRTALICSTMVNLVRKRSSKPAKLEDFILDLKKQNVPETKAEKKILRSKISNVMNWFGIEGKKDANRR